jgi:hypothetical protein
MSIAHHLSTLFVEKLDKRQCDAAEWNASLKSRTPKWSQRVAWDTYAFFHRSLPEDIDRYGGSHSFKERRQTLEEEWRRRSGIKRGSVVWALNDVMTGFWAGGMCREEPKLRLSRPLQGFWRYSATHVAITHQGFDQFQQRR